jgi:hypothetical protein
MSNTHRFIEDRLEGTKQEVDQTEYKERRATIRI